MLIHIKEALLLYASVYSSENTVIGMVSTTLGCEEVEMS